MASHDELLSEMPKLERLSNAQRLKHAKKRRQKQLKRYQDSERALRQSQISMTSVTSIRRESRKILIKFDEDARLRDAINRKDADEVRLYLENGVNPNISNADGLAPLHMCCIEEDSEGMAQLLVEFNADLESRDIEGWTPLHAASNCGNLKMINFLLDHGASLVAINHDDKMPVDVAADSDIRYVLQQKMIEAGYTEDVLGYIRASVAKTMLADLKDSVRSNRSLDIKDKYGSTATHVAAANGYLEVIDFLAENKADLNARDNEGWTPVHAAVCWDQKAAILKLAKYGADVTLRNIHDETPFAISESPEVRQILVDLQSGVDPDELETSMVKEDDGASTYNRKTRSMSVRRGSQREKDGMQKNDRMKEAEMRRASMAEMEDDTQQAVQEVRESIQMDETDGGAAVDEVKCNAETTAEDATPQDGKVEEKVDDQAQKTEGKVEEKEPELKSGNNDVSIKSQEDGLQRDRPKSVLKNKTPTPVITTSTTPNSNIGNPHRDRECCNIS